MKIMLLLISILSTCCLQAQDSTFEHTVQFIQKKISCCSVPFSASINKKVDSLTIDKNGRITLSYSDKSGKQTFNLFELYKEEGSATGIDTIMGGKFIQFAVNENRMRLIRFTTPADAREAYSAFMQLLKLGKHKAKIFSDLNFQQTVDVINIRLSKWSEKGNQVKIIALTDGSTMIYNKRNQSLQFNLFDLTGEDENKRDGIETIPCDPRKHAPLAWINFKSVRGTVAFIRLDCSTPKSELDIIRSAFLHLRSLCRKVSVLNNCLWGAKYFVGRNTILKPGNELLATSIRSVDKKGVILYY